MHAWLQRLIENHLTPLLCGLAVTGYTTLERLYPFVAELLASAGIPKAAVVPFVVGAMAYVSNLIDRRWSHPVLQPAAK